MTENCRFCANELSIVVADLGLTPVSNELRDAETAERLGQTFYPLKAMVCKNCWLVQLTDVQTPEHFTEEYVYFSSYSQSYLRHASDFAASMIDRLELDDGSLVVEVASNDGYLLQYFKRAGVTVLGIDPSANTAGHAKGQHDIDTVVDFFRIELARKLAREGIAADLIVANNVLAHVPDPRDFLGGIPHILKPSGTFTIEFPHLLRLLKGCQFDTIYHEHFSYLSLWTVETMLGAFGLEVYGVEELPTHGGSLRIYVSHAGAVCSDEGLAQALTKVRTDESKAGLTDVEAYQSFASELEKRKFDLLDFLIGARRNEKKVLAYGAPAKGSTMLNYCGVGPELVAFTVDASPHKQGHYLPGVNLPIRELEALLAERPDYILILPWNLRDEIAAQLEPAREWGAKFVVAIPEIQIF